MRRFCSTSFTTPLPPSSAAPSVSFLVSSLQASPTHYASLCSLPLENSFPCAAGCQRVKRGARRGMPGEGGGRPGRSRCEGRAREEQGERGRRLVSEWMSTESGWVGGECECGEENSGGGRVNEKVNECGKERAKYVYVLVLVCERERERERERGGCGCGVAKKICAVPVLVTCSPQQHAFVIFCGLFLFESCLSVSPSLNLPAPPPPLQLPRVAAPQGTSLSPATPFSPSLPELMVVSPPPQRDHGSLPATGSLGDIRALI